MHCGGERLQRVGKRAALGAELGEQVTVERGGVLDAPPAQPLRAAGRNPQLNYPRQERMRPHRGKSNPAEERREDHYRGGIRPRGSFIIEAGRRQPACHATILPKLPTMSPRSNILGSATAVAPVPFDRVRPMLTQESGPLLLSLDPATAASVSMNVDPDTGTVSLQGQFWYRGEYTFAPHPRGTEITYRIKNVSGAPGPVIKLWQRPLLKRQQHDLDTFASALPSRVS